MPSRSGLRRGVSQTPVLPAQRPLWPISRRRRPTNIHYIDHSRAGLNPDAVGKDNSNIHSDNNEEHSSGVLACESLGELEIGRREQFG